MNPRPRIELPSARDDELPLRSLIATSLACLALGLSAAYGLADRNAPQSVAVEPTDLDPDGAEQAAAIAEAEPLPPAPPPAPAPLEPAPTELQAIASVAADAATPEEASARPTQAAPAPVMAAPEVITVAPEATAPPEPAPREAATPATADAPEAEPAPVADARHLRIEPGVFAYLRCEGLPKKRGKYPCPRDRTLERRMREIIEALPSCRDSGAIPRGRSFELRIELGEGGAFKELDVTGPNEAAERAVRACAGPALRKERTTLDPKRMIVSMRFKAR